MGLDDEDAAAALAAARWQLLPRLDPDKVGLKWMGLFAFIHVLRAS